MNIVITGSTRGIGLGMAVEFLKRGHNVCINGSSDKSIRTAREKLTAYSEQIITLAGNVTRRETHEQIWEKTHKQWGTVDIWINNAGVNQLQALPWQLKVSDIDRVLDTNIKGVVHGSCAAYEAMLAQGHGKIFNMEGLGATGPMIPQSTIYSTTKCAVSYFTRSFAKGADSKIVQLGILSPGMVLTDFLRDRGETAEEHAHMVKIINILADRVETVAPFLVRRMLRSRRNYDRIEWLTFPKMLWRFMTAGIAKRKVWGE